MKNLILSVAGLMVLSFTGVSCSSDDNNNTEIVIPVSELPTQVKSFLDIYFENSAIVRIEKDVRSIDEYYEVFLADGTQVDFNEAGVWTEVEGNNKAIQTGFIDPNIVLYVSTNYPTTAIESIDRKAYGFDVDLLNNTELRFDFEGNFLGLDN